MSGNAQNAVEYEEFLDSAAALVHIREDLCGDHVGNVVQGTICRESQHMRSP